MMFDWKMAWSIVSLKFRIIRQTTHVMIGMVIGFFFAAAISAGSIFGVIALRGVDERGTAISVAAASLLTLWLLVPIVLGGGELVLDLKNLALYPIKRPTLVAGLLLAAMAGIPFFATLVVACSLVLHSTSILAGVVLVVAALQLSITAVLLGRVAITFVGMLSGTRFRSIAGALTMIFALGLAGVSQAIPLLLPSLSFDLVEQVRPVFRWTPLGWTPEALGRASVGKLGSAVGFLAIGAIVPIAAFFGWTTIVRKLLSSQSASIPTKEQRPLVPAWMDRIANRQTAAAWAKSLRSLRRDPREWAEIAAFLPLVLAFTLPNFANISSASPKLMLASFLAAASGATMVSTNLFGADGPRFSADVFPGDNFRSVLLGKLLPRMALVGLIVCGGTLALAYIVDGWQYLPVALILVAQSMAISAMAGVFVTTRAPTPLPEKVGGFNGANAGCITPLFQVAALVVVDSAAVVMALPAILVALFSDPVIAAFVALPTFALTIFAARFWLTRQGSRTQEKAPELYAALAKPI